MYSNRYVRLLVTSEFEAARASAMVFKAPAAALMSCTVVALAPSASRAFSKSSSSFIASPVSDPTRSASLLKRMSLPLRVKFNRESSCDIIACRRCLCAARAPATQRIRQADLHPHDEDRRGQLESSIHKPRLSNCHVHLHQTAAFGAKPLLGPADDGRPVTSLVTRPVGSADVPANGASGG